jgi:hypothetical protein
MLAAAHRASCCGGPVGGSFASGFYLLKSIVEKGCDRERSNRTLLLAYMSACAGVPSRMRVLVCLRFAAGRRSRRGAKKVPNSRVALKQSYRIAIVA